MVFNREEWMKADNSLQGHAVRILVVTSSAIEAAVA